MGNFIVKPWPAGTPKPVIRTPLKELHPAFAMDKRNREAYMTVVFDMLPSELDYKVSEKAHRLMYLKLGVRLNPIYWKRRQLLRDLNLAKQLDLGPENNLARIKAYDLWRDFENKVSSNKAETGFKPLPTGGAWLRGRHKKSMLYLDCACVLRDIKRPDLELLIDDIVEELEIEPAIVALVNAYVAGPDDGGKNYETSKISDQYHDACADIAALVKPAPVKKKTVAQKAAAKKAASKKIIIPLPACGYHKTTVKLRQS